MVKKIILVSIIALLIAVTLALDSCSEIIMTTTLPASDNVASSASIIVNAPISPTVPPATISSRPSVTQTSTISDKTVGDILRNADSIAFAKYNMIVSAPGLPAVSSKVFLKKNKMRLETNLQGVNTVTLVDSDTQVMFTYLPDQKTAIKMDWSNAPIPATMDAQSILNYQPQIDGTETIDGKVCMVAEYTVESIASKMWIWQDLGLPVRIESSTPLGKTTVDFKNYDFSDIQDNLFILPAGTQIIDFGLPSGILPSGFPANLPTNLPANLQPFN